MSLTVSTAEEMRELGRRLASAAAAGDLVILSGGLGAGKTTLTQGIGDGLRGARADHVADVRDRAGAPAAAAPAAATAPRDRSLVHADAYRLGGVLELDDLDLDTDPRPR